MALWRLVPQGGSRTKRGRRQRGPFGGSYYLVPKEGDEVRALYKPSLLQGSLVSIEICNWKELSSGTSYLPTSNPPYQSVLLRTSKIVPIGSFQSKKATVFARKTTGQKMAYPKRQLYWKKKWFEKRQVQKVNCLFGLPFLDFSFWPCTGCSDKKCLAKKIWVDRTRHADSSCIFLNFLVDNLYYKTIVCVRISHSHSETDPPPFFVDCPKFWRTRERKQRKRQIFVAHGYVRLPPFYSPQTHPRPWLFRLQETFGTAFCVFFVVFILFSFAAGKTNQNTQSIQNI